MLPPVYIPLRHGQLVVYVCFLLTALRVFLRYGTDDEDDDDDDDDDDKDKRTIIITTASSNNKNNNNNNNTNNTRIIIILIIIIIGPQQGDPLGPLLFSNTVHPLLTSLDTDLQSLSLIHISEPRD